MKKFISIALLLALCLGLFAGCNNTETQSPLESAKLYLFQMYNKAGKDEANKLTADTDVTSVVVYDGTAFQVSWTVEITSGPADSVKIAASDKANHVKVDIMDQPEEDINYTLTATITDDKGDTITVSFKYFTPAIKKVEVSEDKVLLYFPKTSQYVTATDYVYTSSSGSQKNELVLSETKSNAVALTVKKNDNNTVSFVTDGGKYLYCDATHVKFVAEQSEFTQFVLEGAEGGQFIKCATANYKGNAQYLEVYGGYLTCYSKYDDSDESIYTFQLEKAGAAQSAILDAAYALGKDESLAGGPYTLTGVITKINTPWDSGYKNITVTIVCDGITDKPIQCFRLQGEGAENLAVGDTITVTGQIKNYGGTVEFDAKCNLDKVIKADGSSSGGDNGGSEKPAGPVIPTDCVSTPVAGTSYKLAMIQGNKGNAKLFFTGTERDGTPWYLLSTQTEADTVLVTLEAVEGGYRLSFMKGDVKTYLDMYKSGEHYSLRLTTEPTAVYTWNETYKTLVANIEGVDCYIGTYGTYDTFSCNKLEKIADSFPVHFYAAN